jgi:hypothetical protein
MAYKLIVTERADELIDKLTGYLIFQLNNTPAAIHFLDELNEIYVRLKENPFQFSKSKDDYLFRKEYREALLSEMNYRVIFRVEKEMIYVVGVFHF